jgi:hypothetical protein
VAAHFNCGIFRRRWNFAARAANGYRPSRGPDNLARDSAARFDARIIHRQSATEASMSVSVTHLQPIVALVAGVLILIMPRLLNYIVALYLILVGILGLGIIK